MSQPFMDRYGYYQIGDLKTYSVYQVMDYYHKDPQPYVWIYNDDFFSQYDWGQEPTESLKELYKKRAEELREQYDYVVLYYSGGYDSANMLYAFLDNGIYPDEICRVDSRVDTVSHRYLEGKWKTWKKLKEIEKQYPQIKIRKVDNADLVCNWPKIIKDTNEYLDLNLDPIYYWGPRSSIHRLVLDVLHEHIDDWKQLLKDKKKICTVSAVDGVQLRYNFRDKNFVHNYNDVDVYGHMSPIRQMTNKTDRDTLEFFYWAPTETCAKIMIKQGHLAKKFYTDMVAGKIQRLINMKEVALAEKTNFPWMRFLTYSYEPFKKIIYPRLFEGDEQFYRPKEINLWGNVDHWYYNSNFPNSQEHWKAIHLSLYEDKNSHWRRFFYDGEIAKGHDKIRSIDYTL
jgi:hypothetical protein